MATGGARGLYAEDDKVDEYLLNQVSKWVLYNRLGLLARDLGISQAHFSRIIGANRQPEEQIFQILYKWYTTNTLTVKDLIAKMATWQKEKYLDPNVWIHLQSKIDPAVLMTSFPILKLPAPPESPSPFEFLHNLYEDNLESPAIPYIVEEPQEKQETIQETSCIAEEPTEASGPPDNNLNSAESEHENKRQTLSGQISTEDNRLPYGMANPPSWLQMCLKEALRRRCRNFLSTDWLPVEKAKSFQLQDYYVEGTWLKHVNTARRFHKDKMKGLQDVFKDIDRIGPINILAIGEAGTGKSCCMAMLALDWAQSEGTEKWCPSSEWPWIWQQKGFDYVFLIQLCHVNDNSPLEKIILAQHGLRNKDIPEEEISNILETNNERVLLLLDGYDEYQKGTNADIDAAIEDGIGECFLILTSRDDGCISAETRKRINGEIEITGFDEHQAKKYASSYFESEETATRMYRKAKDVGIDGLLRLPIILLMVCVLFDENEDLPKSQTKIISNIVEMFMDRSALKYFGQKAIDIAGLDEMLYKLGELAWKTLRKETRQLLLLKKEVENMSDIFLKLGLLHEVTLEEKTSLTGRMNWLMFPHKLVHEYWAGYYASKRLHLVSTKEEVSEIFDLPSDMKRHWNVMKFTCGLLEYSSVLIEKICEEFVSILKNTTFDVWNENSYQFFYNYTYLEELNREKSSSSLDPFHNSVICCMNNRSSVLSAKCQCYYFYGTDRFENYRTDVQTTVQHTLKGKSEPCAIFIRETSDSPLFMHTVQNAISKIEQPVEYLIIEGASLGSLFYGFKSSLTVSDYCFIHGIGESGLENYLTESSVLTDVGRQREFSKLIDFSDKSVVRFTACDFRSKSLQLFVDSIRNSTTLHTFELVYCSNIDENLICRLGQNQNLATLTLRQCNGKGLSIDGQTMLCEQMKLMGKLTHLVIHDMYLNIGSIKSTCLRVVSLCGCKILSTEGLALMQHLAKCPVQKLDLNNNHFDGMFIKLSELAEVSYPHLENLSLVTEDRIERNDLVGIARLLHNDKLPVLKSIVLDIKRYQNDYHVIEKFVKSCRLYRNGQCEVVQTVDGKSRWSMFFPHAYIFSEDDLDFPPYT